MTTAARSMTGFGLGNAEGEGLEVVCEIRSYNFRSLDTKITIQRDLSALEPKLVTDGFTKKYSVSVGNSSDTSFTVTHNLSTRDVQVQVYDNATYDTVEVDIVRTSTSVVTITFATAPSSNAYRVVVIG